MEAKVLTSVTGIIPLKMKSRVLKFAIRMIMGAAVPKMNGIVTFWFTIHRETHTPCYLQWKMRLVMDGIAHEKQKLGVSDVDTILRNQDDHGRCSAQMGRKPEYPGTDKLQNMPLLFAMEAKVYS